MAAEPITENTLFYGDNLSILREHFPDECVDLIYLDPPFNSNRNFNVLFKDEHGTDSEAQITAFEDTWHWNSVTEQTCRDLTIDAPDHIGKMLESLREFVGENQMMAYLVMMTVRLVELHRVLKPTGSLYLHCDPTASHYLKVVMDTIFGVKNYRNEITWVRTAAHNDAKNYANVADIILYYTKTGNFFFDVQHQPYSQEYIKKYYKHKDGNGRIFLDRDLTAAGLSGGGYQYEWKGIKRIWRCPLSTMEKYEHEERLYYTQQGTPRLKQYLDEMHGVPATNVWSDIPPINSMAGERLGYPTQKPLALLERIIQASSNPDDIVLDPFCGCGTAIAAAQKLERKWIGIDITHLSIALQKYRLEAMFPNIQFKVKGEPTDLGAARKLAQDDRYQFQWWALSLIRAKPLGGQEGSKEGKKGSDKGIDGVIAFIDDDTGKARRVLVQVKSGHVKSGDIRDLRGTVEREKAAIGVFITLEEPSRDMKTEAIKAGFYHSIGWGRDFPRIQILTIDELLHGVSVQMPSQFGTFKQAQKVQQAAAMQTELGIG